MTYCVGLALRGGLVMLADTRTNAGVDSVSCYRKLHLFDNLGDRIFAFASAGNLSVTQSAIEILREGMANPDDNSQSLNGAASMFRAAQIVGRALHKARSEIEPELKADNISFDATLLFGGQVRGGPIKLFMIYGTGNFIECGPDTPFLQIGECKYGKPILDRAVRYDTDLLEAVKVGLISFDSTMRSNLAVGMPIDLIVLRPDRFAFELRQRIEADDDYFSRLSDHWSTALKNALSDIPAPPYKPIS